MQPGQWEHPRPWIDHVYRKDEDFNVSDRELGIKICDLVKRCPWIPSEEADLWISDITCGNIDTCTTLLLTLLPNLRVIELLHGFVVGDYVRRMLRQIADWDCYLAPEVTSSQQGCRDTDGDSVLRRLGGWGRLPRPAVRFASC